jgi:tetratricopeptide (TPR) repeat protein
LHLLGVIAAQMGKHDVAGEYIREVIRLKPDFAEAHGNLGNVLQAQGRLNEAAASYQEALRLKPDYAEAHNNLGNTQQKQGRLAEAAASFQEALRLKPDYAEAHSNLGNVLQEQGKVTEAVARYQEAIRLKPDFAEAHNNLGHALQEQGKAAEAIASYQQALRLKPDYVEALNNLGNALQEQGMLAEAVSSYQQALRLKPDYAEAHNNLGIAFQNQGKANEAAACYRQAIALKPEYTEAHNNLGSALLVQGRPEEALASLQQALRLSPGFPMAYHQLGRMARDGHYQFSAAEIEQVRQLLTEPRWSLKARTLLYFTLAYVLEKNRDYDAAFENYRQGNLCKRQLQDLALQTFNIERHRQEFDELIATFDSSLFSRLAPLGHPSDVPVFIVGMPRSGTTLVEQILASHPRCAGAGELKEISSIQSDLPRLLNGPEKYPACVANLSRDTIWRQAEHYLQRLREADPQALRVSDKMPQNYTALGLIAVLFPHARVIHCRRDPRDTCVSCFCENFSEIKFSSTLDDLGLYYGEYERLMAHWRQALPLPMLDVHYEQLVTGPEAIIRELISFCGLDWDDRCLLFHQARRNVYTASNLQVRQPMYATSIGRWRRFMPHLDRLLELLNPYLPQAG